MTENERMILRTVRARAVLTAYTGVAVCFLQFTLWISLMKLIDVCFKTPFVIADAALAVSTICTMYILTLYVIKKNNQQREEVLHIEDIESAVFVIISKE